MRQAGFYGNHAGDEEVKKALKLLAIFDTTNQLVEPYREDIFYTIGDACRLHLDAPREVNVLLSDRDMQRWDAIFIESVKRDGIILYARTLARKSTAKLTIANT